jgi:predicted amidohydrolase YtcJ
MNKSNRRVVIVMSVLFVFGSFGAQVLLAAEPADTIITNAKVYTVNPQQKWAEAIAVRADKIIFVGDAKSADSYKGPSTKVIDAKGKLVLPGFTDCHVHFMSGSLGLTQVDLNGANTIEEIQKRVKDYAAAHPTLPWITGMGWQYPTFGPTALPNKDSQ